MTANTTELQKALQRLEDAVVRYDNAALIALCLCKAGPRGANFYETLLSLGDNVALFKDKFLETTYQNLLDGYREYDTQDKTRLDVEYGAFLFRLSRLVDGTARQANMASILVKTASGLPNEIGIFGPEDWR